MKTVVDMLEQNKIQIQSTNSHLKKIFSNTVTNNPASTINNTDSITGKQLTAEGKKMDDSTKETEEINKFCDPKEKERENKTQSQSKRTKYIQIGQTLMEMQHQTLYHHVHSAKRMTTNS